MEILTTDQVLQFSYGHKLLLSFTDLRSDTSTGINEPGDTWKVVIIRPDGTTLTKTTSLEFPDNAESKIAVPISPLDLDRTGNYYYQVVKTTGGIEVIFGVESFTVVASLPIGLSPGAPSSPSENFFPIYGALGELNASLLKYNTTTGQLELDGVPRYGQGKKGSDIASATTINLDNATGDIVDVTGTATISGITLAEGRGRVVRFTGALTLVHGASLVLPNAGSNIVTAAGDFAIFRGYASGVVRCVVYQRASGQPLAGGGGLTSLQDDPSPTLGANLTLNGHDILGAIEDPGTTIDGGLI